MSDTPATEVYEVKTTTFLAAALSLNPSISYQHLQKLVHRINGETEHGLSICFYVGSVSSALMNFSEYLQRRYNPSIRR